MDVKASLKGQYHAALKMLRQTVEQCPDSVWISGEHPRNFWRIAFHANFYAHLYLQQSEEEFEPWPKGHPTSRVLWENPDVVEPLSQQEMMDYIDFVDESVNATVDRLDLSAESTGFSWYTNMNKLDHQLMNIRHIQGHVGQLSELLMAHGVDTDWSGIARSAKP